MLSLYWKNKADDTWGTDRANSGSALVTSVFFLNSSWFFFIRLSFEFNVRLTNANFLVFFAFPILTGCYEIERGSVMLYEAYDPTFRNTLTGDECLSKS